MISAERIEEACVLVGMRGGEPAAGRISAYIAASGMRAENLLPLADVNHLRLMVEEAIGFLLDRPATDFSLARWAWSGRATWRLFCSSGSPLSEGEAREAERALHLVLPTTSAEAMLSVDFMWDDQAAFGVNRRFTGDAPI